MKILLLGDSHTHGPYGKRLESLLKKAGHDVTRVGWVSANADHYLTGGWKKLTLGGAGNFDTARAQRYDLAVITLGTNDAAGLSVGGPAAGRAASIRKLADMLDARAIWWVGPPAFDSGKARTYNKAFAQDDLNARSARLWEATAPLFPGTAIDPRDATKPFVSSKDIHFDDDGGKAWAQFVVASLPLTSGTNVPATTPRIRAASPNQMALVWTVVGVAAAFYLWKRSRRRGLVAA